MCPCVHARRPLYRCWPGRRPRPATFAPRRTRSPRALSNRPRQRRGRTRSGQDSGGGSRPEKDDIESWRHGGSSAARRRRSEILQGHRETRSRFGFFGNAKTAKDAEGITRFNPTTKNLAVLASLGFSLALAPRVYLGKRDTTTEECDGPRTFERRLRALEGRTRTLRLQPAHGNRRHRERRLRRQMHADEDRAKAMLERLASARPATNGNEDGFSIFVRGFLVTV